MKHSKILTQYKKRRKRKERYVIVNFDVPLLDLDDQPMPGDRLNKIVADTLALMDREGDGAKKREWVRLAKRIKKTNGPIKLEVEELNHVKQLVGRVHTGLVVDQVWEIIDNAKGNDTAVEQEMEQLKEREANGSRVRSGEPWVVPEESR